MTTQVSIRLNCGGCSRDPLDHLGVIDRTGNVVMLCGGIRHLKVDSTRASARDIRSPRIYAHPGFDPQCFDKMEIIVFQLKSPPL